MLVLPLFSFCFTLPPLVSHSLVFHPCNAYEEGGSAMSYRSSAVPALSLPPLLSVILPLLAFALAVCLPAIASANVEYGFSDENPSVCFVEEVAVKSGGDGGGSPTEHFFVGTYVWQPHAKNSRARFVMLLKDPDDEVVHNLLLEANEDGSPKTFAMKAPANKAGPYTICVALGGNSGVLADDPIFISFDVDQSNGKDSELEEEVAVALKQQYGRKRQLAQGERDPLEQTERTTEPTREVVDGMEVFVYRDFGGQVKSILQAPLYLQALKRELKALELDIRRKTGVLREDLEKEGRMRGTSESTFNRVWVCAVMVIAAIVVVVTWQFSLLKRTLKRKKKI